MASTAAESSTSAAIEVPPLSPKLRRKPQRRDIGARKCYTDEDEFQVDLNMWEYEQEERRKLVKQRERAQEQQREQQRNRSARQRGSTNETDSQRRVRQRHEKHVSETQEQDEMQAQIQRERERGIASGELIPLQCEQLQFQDDAERERYNMQCSLGCPHADPVCMDMVLYGHRFGSGRWHVKVRLFTVCDVCVQGKVVGYGCGARPVHRIDTCVRRSCHKARCEETYSEQAHGARAWSVFGDA